MKNYLNAEERTKHIILLAMQETAKECFSQFKSICKQLEQEFSHFCKSAKEAREETFRYQGVLAVKRRLIELAKQFGVEVEE